MTMYNILPLFKSHYSIGRSILTLEKPDDKLKGYSSSIFDTLKQNGLDTLVLVEDNVSGLLQASKQCDESKIKLVFGLRMDVTEDLAIKDDAALKKRAKYIVLAKNPKAYQALIKIASCAAKEGFYYSACIDFAHLKKYWTKDLALLVPFYDSFLYMNAFEGHLHVPDFTLSKPIFLIEDNDMPFDDALKSKVETFCSKNGYDTMPAQSIFYKSPKDFPAYVAFRCVHNRGGNQKSTLEKPDLEHMSSDQFNFDKWLKRNATNV